VLLKSSNPANGARSKTLAVRFILHFQRLGIIFNTTPKPGDAVPGGDRNCAWGQLCKCEAGVADCLSLYGSCFSAHGFGSFSQNVLFSLLLSSDLC
jgi:hypothetical protein